MTPEGTQEEAMAATADNGGSSANNDVHSHHAVVKRKRTKRQRLLQAAAPRAAPTSPASSSGDFSSSTTTEEEEDMANCLMLLARGHAREADTKKLTTRLEGESGGGEAEGGEKISSRRSAEAATTTNGKADSYVYECKTCNKCFPSFQALGGHRASHKKPKTPSAAAAAAAADDKKAVDEDGLQINIASNPNLNVLPHSDGCRTSANSFNSHNNGDTAVVNNSKTTRVHECSICGSEFSSGQALGGHMRRHRPAVTVPEPPQEAPKKERSLLSLDLNLPAPLDDDRGDFPRSPSFAFAAQPPLIFSASALVDCHY